MGRGRWRLRRRGRPLTLGPNWLSRLGLRSSNGGEGGFLAHGNPFLLSGGYGAKIRRSGQDTRWNVAPELIDRDLECLAAARAMFDMMPGVRLIGSCEGRRNCLRTHLKSPAAILAPPRKR